MAALRIIPVLLISSLTRCGCDQSNSYVTGGVSNTAEFGEILRPPPPPQLSPILPVPFHGGADRNNRQNLENGYQYPPPYPLSPQFSGDFKFPAPFYKQYNFNFVPSPQPFSTTPSPSLFQKVSGWLFPSQQTSFEGSGVVSTNSIGPIKKDCNPCNLVPWLPVIRYNLGNKNVYHSALPTYGPPSNTAYVDSVKILQQNPQPFVASNDGKGLSSLFPGPPHDNYGPPAPSFNGANRVISSTYGPPSATHVLDVQSPVPPSSTFSLPSSSYAQSSSSLSKPRPSYGIPSSSNGASSSFNTYNPQILTNTLNNYDSSTFKPPLSSYGTPGAGVSYPINTSFQPVTPHYEPNGPNNNLPHDDVEILRNLEPVPNLQLPNVSPPTTFKNSYGEPITNSHIFDIPYPVSATAAESTKIKTQVLPQDGSNKPRPNISFTVANPAPFTLNRGRNIHTLQPVALPNLSVSPLPPIFNARPFRPIPPRFTTNILQGINHMQQSATNVNIEPSIPIAEYTHSVDYPATIIQSPIIDINPSTNFNQSKAYRNIPNSFVLDDVRDISSQASEDHISATKSIGDSSFETTGIEIGNDLYETGAPSNVRPISQLPPNHKPVFADLRGLKEEDIDKYRTEDNLQHIDSPLLYLKPSAPHKNYRNFIPSVSSSTSGNEYEIYDDVPTTAATPSSTFSSNSWEESKTDYGDDYSQPSLPETVYQPKIVQIIVPYTTGEKKENSYYNYNTAQTEPEPTSTPKEQYQPRKVPSLVGDFRISTITENYNTVATTEEVIPTTVSENYDSDHFLTTHEDKDSYDVKEPPFDIIKLQHTIDDWTQQEYSNHYQTPPKTRGNEKHAKKIPDEYFTTTTSANSDATLNYNYDFYDHVGASSIQHHVADESTSTSNKVQKEYNVIERSKNTKSSANNEKFDDGQRLHIYTAASSFRTTSTTTPAPWGKIQTSISPLTKEKVYVVTSKPWREPRNITNEWHDIVPFESKKTNLETDQSAASKFLFKSPRFLSRPSFDFSSGGKVESGKSDLPYGFSRSWYQRINELETQAENRTTHLEAVQEKDATGSEEDSRTTDTSEHERRR